MPFVTPKTDWLHTDGVSNDDMNRIEGNTGDLNERVQAKEAYPKKFFGIATAAGWVGASPPFTQAVTVTGLSANDEGSVGLGASPSGATTQAQRTMARGALIAPTSMANDTVTLSADGDKPTADLPIMVTVWGKIV